jgi:cell division septum initiation protein DivIVA
VRKALEQYLEDAEDLADAIASYEEHLKSGKNGYSLEEMKERYGL